MNHKDQLKSRRQLVKELAVARQRLDELESAVNRHRGVEISLSEGEAEMRAILDALPDLVIRVHRDGRFLDVKSPSQDILSLPEDEIIGRNIRETGLPQKVTAIHLWSTEAALRTGAVQTFHYRLEVPRGRRDFEGRAVACAEDEALLVIRDVTESNRAIENTRQLEAKLHQARRMESIGRLAAGMAHNLNNLLMPIRGYAELLSASDKPLEKQRAHLRAILKATDSASELTRQLLAVGREQTHEIRRIDLRQVVTECEQILRRSTRDDVDLQIRHSQSPVMIQADPFQIEQILLNLTLNAQDAILGRGTVVVETRGITIDGHDPDLRPGHYGSLRVSDTGTGVEDTIREKIFDPFFTTKEPGEGTGLGLASVHGIVQQHGGDIRLESALNEGSTFEILFPHCEDVGRTRPLMEVKDRRETVLVVEDDEIVNRLVSQILREHGYLVMSAAGGEECLQLVERCSEPIELLLTDLVMPQINGRELYERLQPLLPDLKVLYMSGYTDDVIAAHGVIRNGVRLVQKPFSIPRLLQEVREVLGTRDGFSPDPG